MPKLVVNPGSPTAWEIQLKPGVNSLGRGQTNDFKLADPSVSGSHCQIIVSDGGVVLKDLGSTNGTFINRAPVREAALQDGQTLHLGGVMMLFSGGTPAAPAAAMPAVRLTASASGATGAAPIVLAAPAAAASPAPVARPVVLAAPAAAAAPAPAGKPVVLAGRPPGAGSAPVVLAGPPPAAAVPPMVPVAGAAIPGGKQNCKFHPRNPGRFHCPKCGRFFCELCVTTRQEGGEAKKFCRTCGVECAQVQVALQLPTAPKGFFGRMPGAFIYPFRGAGIFMLILSAIVLSFVKGAASSWSILLAIAAFGYLFIYMQNIVHATANEETEMPGLPGLDDVFGGAFRFAGTIGISFGIPITLLVIKAFADPESEHPINIPMSAVMATAALGCLYFPMAFLAVAMKDTLMAANPLVVIPAIIKVPLGYLVTAVITLSALGVGQLGDMVMEGVKSASLHTKDMGVLFMSYGLRSAWGLASVYLVVVSMRVLGLLYVANKHKFGWFSR